MTDTGSNPFAEPDFSALHSSGAEDATDEGYSDEDVEDVEDELEDEDEDELDEGEEFDDFDEVPVKAAAVSERAADADDAGNRVEGGTARSVLEHVARSIVDDPEGVAVDVGETRTGIRLSLRVAQGDMGRIIGRRGRTAQALRTLVRAAAARDGQEASVDIVD
jgi:predicted RNA-binding protein YlqC (UPF0109 family)